MKVKLHVTIQQTLKRTYTSLSIRHYHYSVNFRPVLKLKVIFFIHNVQDLSIVHIVFDFIDCDLCGSLEKVRERPRSRIHSSPTTKVRIGVRSVLATSFTRVRYEGPLVRCFHPKLLSSNRY